MSKHEAAAAAAALGKQHCNRSEQSVDQCKAIELNVAQFPVKPPAPTPTDP